MNPWLQSLVMFVSWSWAIVLMTRAFIYMRLPVPQFLRRLSAELGIMFYPWPIGLVFAIVMIHIGKGYPSPLLNIANTAMNIIMWWVLRNVDDDDDRWKRRRRKAVEAVKRAGARLVIAPIPQGA